MRLKRCMSRLEEMLMMRRNFILNCLEHNSIFSYSPKDPATSASGSSNTFSPHHVVYEPLDTMSVRIQCLRPLAFHAFPPPSLPPNLEVYPACVARLPSGGDVHPARGIQSNRMDGLACHGFPSPSPSPSPTQGVGSRARKRQVHFR